MKHARLICNQKEKFQCSECRVLTSAGYQLIGSEETKFVCKDCYVQFRNQYPMKGKSLKQLVPADVALSSEYDPETYDGEVEESLLESSDSGYLGELLPDGNGGWREPTPEELRAMSQPVAKQETTVETSDLSTMEIKYRFTTDNKLQVILPRKCRIDDHTYELIVTTEDA